MHQTEHMYLVGELKSMCLFLHLAKIHMRKIKQNEKDLIFNTLVNTAFSWLYISDGRLIRGK